MGGKLCHKQQTPQSKQLATVRENVRGKPFVNVRENAVSKCLENVTEKPLGKVTKTLEETSSVKYDNCETKKKRPFNMALIKRFSFSQK